MQAVAWIVVLFLWLTSCHSHARRHFPDHALVELVAIEPDSRGRRRKELGSWAFIGGFQLRSGDARFGGLSGLSFGSDGAMYAVSDRGYWVRAQASYDREGRLLNLTDWTIKPILTPERDSVSGALSDAEALTRAADGSLIVAFEQRPRLWRYPPAPATFEAPPSVLAVPPEVTGAPRNGGLEGITVLPDGRVLALTEEFRNEDGSTIGWLIEDGRFDRISYVPSEGFEVTDCAALRSGDVVVLERRQGWLTLWEARVKRIRGRSLRAEAKILGEELMSLKPPFPVDNFEGIAVQENLAHGTMIYLVSDDNYNPFQSTLLLQFRLLKAQD